MTTEPECIMDLRTWLFFFHNCKSPEDKRKAAEKRLALVKEMRSRPKGWTTPERKMLYKEEGRLEAMLGGQVLRPRNQVHPKHAHIERNRYGKVQHNFADEAVRNCNNKTSGNGDKQATRKPDLDSAAVNERKRNE